MTVETCVKHFETDNLNVTILDAPGHRELVPTMVLSSFLADLAILVVDVCDENLAAQTKEHLRLLRACGVSFFLVAVNKMDRKLRAADEEDDLRAGGSVADTAADKADEIEPKKDASRWDLELFEDRKEKILKFMTDIRIKAGNVKFVPISGFLGLGLDKRAVEEVPSLLESLDAFKHQLLEAGLGSPGGIGGGNKTKTGVGNTSKAKSSSSRGGTTNDDEQASEEEDSSTPTKKQKINEKATSAPSCDLARTSPPIARFAVTDICFTSGSTSAVSGKLLRHPLSVGDQLLILPALQKTTVKSLLVKNKNVRCCPPNLFIDMLVLNLDPLFCSAGSVLVSVSDRPSSKKLDEEIARSKLHDKIKCVVNVLPETTVKIVKGQQLMCYCGTQIQPCTVGKIVGLVGGAAASGTKVKCLVPGQTAELVLHLRQSLFFEEGTLCYSRVVLRCAGESVAIGVFQSGVGGEAAAEGSV